MLKSPIIIFFLFCTGINFFVFLTFFSFNESFKHHSAIVEKYGTRLRDIGLAVRGWKNYAVSFWNLCSLWRFSTTGFYCIRDAPFRFDAVLRARLNLLCTQASLRVSCGCPLFSLRVLCPLFLVLHFFTLLSLLHLLVTVLTLLNCSRIGCIGFNRAETNCGIARILGIPLGVCSLGQKILNLYVAKGAILCTLGAKVLRKTTRLWSQN